eukprot:jgi/Botrbrau1/12373/Bobra.0084s0001.1
MLARRLWEPARAVFSAVGIATVATAGAAAYTFSDLYREALPDKFVIEINLETCKLVEKLSKTAFEILKSDVGRAGQELELHQVVDALHSASRDPRVAGVLVLTGGPQAFQGLAHVEELRNAVTHFRHKTRDHAFTVAHSTSFGEGGCFGTLPYYFATACDKVFMQASGLLSISGLASETWFVRGLLDKWKITPHWFARERYKNVISPYIEKGHTREHAEATVCILNSWLTHVAGQIAASRTLSPAEVRCAINTAPFTSEQALSLRLIDGALYRDEVYDMFLHRDVPEPLEKVQVQDYIHECRRERTSILAHLNSGLKDILMLLDPQEPQKTVLPAQKPAIALLTATGQIISGLKQPHQKAVISSVGLCNDIATARNDPSVKAVVLRIDSPGGSAVASDSIYREVARTRLAGKPVVVSMGNIAASGGYYIASPASLIIAQPSTITGSIGVVFGKFDMSGLLREYGINPEAVTAGTNATAMSWFNGFTRAQARQVNDIVDYVYHGFINKVAESRQLPVEDVQKIAKGRMWSGVDALALGLVDQLGGLPDAIRLAKQLAELPLDEHAVEVREIPTSKFSWLPALQTLQQVSTALRSHPDAVGSVSGVDYVPGLHERGGFASWAALLCSPKFENTRSFLGASTGLRMEATGVHFPWDA